MNSEKIKLGLWSGVGGALATMYVGFNFGGWVTNGGAVAMAKETAATAVAERLGTICVAQFNGERKTCPDEWQRCLGNWPLHRRANLVDHAGCGEVRKRRCRRLCQAAGEDKLSAPCERGARKELCDGRQKQEG